MVRMERVNALIKRELSNMILLGEIKDPRVKMVTIQNVDVSKDLHYARVRFSVLSDDPQVIEAATEGLNNSSGYVRKLIAQKVSMRYTPQFQFYYDKGIVHAARMDKLIEDVKRLHQPKEKTDA